MKLDRSHVQHVAKLARLRLSEEEEVRFVAQLSEILEAVDALQAVDTEGVPPTTFALESASHARPDEVRDELTSTQALANAPQKVETSFAIPRVLE